MFKMQMQYCHVIHFSVCRTITGTRCVFPFRYNGRVHNTCIYANNDGNITTIIMVIMITGNSVEQVVPGPDFTAGVKNVTVPEGRLDHCSHVYLYLYLPEGRLVVLLY